MTAGFLRSLEQAKLFVPARSDGSHRRHSRYELRLAARVRGITDQGTPVEAACRIIILEDQLSEALELTGGTKPNTGPASAERRQRVARGDPSGEDGEVDRDVVAGRGRTGVDGTTPQTTTTKQA